MKTIATLLLLLSAPNAANHQLTVEITNARPEKGTFRVGIYKANGGFGDDKAKPEFGKNVKVTNAATAKVSFEVPEGTYAIAVYQDVNDNTKLDKNMVGYPKEPFGFSNNFRPKLSAPKFKDCSFELKSDKTLTIKLID